MRALIVGVPGLPLERLGDRLRAAWPDQRVDCCDLPTALSAVRAGVVGLVVAAEGLPRAALRALHLADPTLFLLSVRPEPDELLPVEALPGIDDEAGLSALRARVEALHPPDEAELA